MKTRLKAQLDQDVESILFDKSKIATNYDSDSGYLTVSVILKSGFILSSTNHPVELRERSYQDLDLALNKGLDLIRDRLFRLEAYRQYYRIPSNYIMLNTTNIWDKIIHSSKIEHFTPFGPMSQRTVVSFPGGLILAHGGNQASVCGADKFAISKENQRAIRKRFEARELYSRLHANPINNPPGISQ